MQKNLANIMSPLKVPAKQTYPLPPSPPPPPSLSLPLPLSLVDPVFGVEVLILLADEVLGGVPSVTGPALD